MTILQAIVLGIVEGLTEFLPISSTFHLIWTAKFLNIAHSDFQKFFEVIIQSGAILAVMFLYLNTLRKDWDLVKKVIASFIPTAIVGFLLYKTIKTYFFEDYFLQLGIFALVGIIFILFEKYRGNYIYTRIASQLSYPEAATIGLAQSLAVIPGVSRAGAVIIMLMLLNVKRDEAAKYSFLLAVPTIFGAAALDVYKSWDTVIISQYDWLLIVIGFIAAFITALAVMKWFISFLQQNTIAIFGWYRLLFVCGLFFMWVLTM